MRSPKPPTSAAKPSKPTRLKASSPADLLALVPYLLGFRPTESLVAVLIRDGQVLLTARLDLPPVAALDEVRLQFADLADRHEAAAVVLFAFSDDARGARAVLAGMVAGQLSETAGGGRFQDLLDAVYVGPSRWWSLMCTAGCCPAEGTPYDVSSHPLAAAAVYAGLGSAPDRTAVEAQVSGPPPGDVDVLSRLGRDVSCTTSTWSPRRRSRAMASALSDFLAHPRGLTDADCVRFAVLAADLPVRDVAWARMSRADIDDHLDLWGQVVARTPAPWQAAPLCLLGMAAWISGNGALQNCCSDRARRVSPGYTLTDLLEEINQRALPPSCWDRMAADLREVTAGSQ